MTFLVQKCNSSIKISFAWMLMQSELLLPTSHTVVSLIQTLVSKQSVFDWALTITARKQCATQCKADNLHKKKNWSTKRFCQSWDVVNIGSMTFPTGCNWIHKSPINLKCLCLTSVGKATKTSYQRANYDQIHCNMDNEWMTCWPSISCICIYIWASL